MLEVFLALAGIVLPAALLTVALRRWFGGPSWREAGIFLALALASLHLAAFTPAMPVAIDEVVRGYPYRGIFGEVTSRNPDTNDTVKQMLPWMQVAREELFALRAPLWNRYSFSGYPLLANSQSAPFSPFFLATLFVPLPQQIVAMAGLKLFVALLFGYLFLRREGCSGPAAAFGSIVFGYSIFQNVYLYYPLGAVTSLLPALAWALLGAMREARRRDVLALALVVAAAFAAGHPESVLMLALAGGVLLAAEIVRGPRDRGTWQRAALAIAAAATGALLSAAVWVPAIEQILISQRVDAIAGGEFGRVRYPANALWVLFNPDGYGNPARGNWSWIFHYIMVAPTYVGLIPLALMPGALLAPRSDSRTRFCAAMAIIAFLVAMNWTVLGAAFNELPLARWSANDRLRVLAVLFVAVAAARRLEWIAKAGPSVVDAAAFAAVASGAGYVFAVRLGIVLQPIHAIGLVGLAGFAAATKFAVPRQGDAMGRIRWIGGSAAAAVALELWLFNLPFNALTKREYYAPRLAIVDAIHARAPDQPYRVAGRDWVFLPNASAHYGLEDIRGSDPMAWGRYAQFFSLIHPEGKTSDVGRVMNFEHPIVDYLNVLFLISEPGSEFGETWELVYRGADGDLYRNREWIPRFFAPRRWVGVAAGGVPVRELGEVSDFRESVLVEGEAVGRTVENGEAAIWIGRMRPGRFRLTVEARGRTLVASSEPALPGWRVEVNGEPPEVLRVNGAFVGFFVPDGRSRVVVEYAPASFRWGLAGSLLTAAMLVMGGLRWREGSGERENENGGE